MKTKNISNILLGSLFLILVLFTAHGAPAEGLYNENWKNLTLREKIGQTVIVTGDSLFKLNLTDEQLAAYLKKFPVGGVFDGGEVIQDNGPSQAVIAERIARLRKVSQIPVLICGDMEDGAGANVAGFTKITHLSGVGATRSTSLAFDFGRAISLEARSIGFNWLFAPVADLVQNPFNYLVAARSISDDPHVANPLLISLMCGYQDNGIAATAKHFPGDGVDYRNQHFTTSCNGLTKIAWNKNHGAVFQSLIDHGVMTIMTGHISLPCYQDDSEIVDGRYLPATLSYDITTRLLKEKMGFKGVVVSDALMMGGFIKYYGDDACVRCFAAGTDMLLWPPERYFDDMEKAILDGRVPMSRLDDAVQRIWKLKQKLGLLNPNEPLTYPLSNEDKRFVEKTAQDIAEKSITLVRDRHQRLPLNCSDIHKVAIIPISSQEKRVNEAAACIQSLLSARGINAAIYQGLWLDDMPKVANENNLIIYLVEEAGIQDWTGKSHNDNWTSGMAGRDKTIVISLDNPFHSDEFIAADTYINAYDSSTAVIKAVTRGLFGEIPFLGQSPMNLKMAHQLSLDAKVK